MMATIEYTENSFIKGVEYKVKFEGEARYTARKYEGTQQMYTENENGDIVEGKIVAHFNSARGGSKWFPFNQIISAIEIDATKQKAKKAVTCNRCFGAGKFEHITIDQGICYKCGGTGTL